MLQLPELKLANQKIETCSAETSEQASTKNVVTQKASFLVLVLLYLYISSMYTFAYAHPHMQSVSKNRIHILRKETVLKL